MGKFKNFKIVLRSVVILPLMLANLSMIDPAIMDHFNILFPSLKEQRLFEERARKIDDYFASKDMPLSGYGLAMVKTADRYNLDWRLLPAIAIRESTGGKFACQYATHNPFGYGSCKIDFDNIEEAINVVAKTLAGENPGTAHLYKDKTVLEKLKAYNPSPKVPNYPKQVLAFMNLISSEDLSSEIL